MPFSRGIFRVSTVPRITRYVLLSPSGLIARLPASAFANCEH